MPKDNTIGNLKITTLPIYTEDNGNLYVAEEFNQIPFNIKRVFFVAANSGDLRGKHAHLTCYQYLICSSGKISIECTDGKNQKKFTIDCSGQGLLMPPGIWSSQKYIENNSVLTVLCNQLFDPDDYIRDYSDFLKYKKII